MSLIVTQTSVLLQSSDANWYWVTLAQNDDGSVSLDIDEDNPVAPPSGATAYALLRFGSNYYRWTLAAEQGHQTNVPTLSVADGSELDRIVLLLNTLNYAITVTIDEGSVQFSVDQTSYPLTAGLFSIGGGGCAYGVPCGTMPGYPAQGTYPGSWVRFQDFPFHTMP